MEKQDPPGCSSRIKPRTQRRYFTCIKGFFRRDRVADWHLSPVCQHFLTKHTVVDSHAVSLLQSSKQNESSASHLKHLDELTTRYLPSKSHQSRFSERMTHGASTGFMLPVPGHPLLRLCCPTGILQLLGSIHALLGSTTWKKRVRDAQSRCLSSHLAS
jgi:hypothetical protein